MSKSNVKEEREAILNAISRHPNTRFAKLFHEVDNEPNQKNIVLLLIELTQQKDFYVDFNVSLQYFLNLYEKLDAANKEFLFNEGGLLVFNATQIYSRRVDCVQQRLEDQLAELSSGQESKEKNNSDGPTPDVVPEKPKRRKRLVEASDPYEIEIVSRKYRKLAPEKRFAPGTKLDTSKLFDQNLHAETYTHPALWQHAEMIDLDNDEEYDTKKNYRLFTNHIEHRYNTLVPDINFRLYFKMKDFMDEEDEREGESDFCQDSDWPPLSQAYVKRYIDLEDQVLAQDVLGFKKSISSRNSPKCSKYVKPMTLTDSGIDSSSLQTSADLSSTLDLEQKSEPIKTNNSEKDDINSIEKNTGIITNQNSTQLGSNSESTEPSQADSGIDLSFLQQSTESQSQSLDITSVNVTMEDDVGKSNTTQEEGLLPSESVALNISEKCSENISTNEDNKGNLHNTQETSVSLNTEQLQLGTEKPEEGKNVQSENVRTDLSDSIINDMALTAINSTINHGVDQQKMETNVEASEPKIEDNTISNKDITEKNLQDVEQKQQNGTKKKDIEEALEIIVHIENDGNANCVSTNSCASLSPSNDEGVYFSDIDDTPLTPYTIHLDLKTLNKENSKNDEKLNDANTYKLPEEKLPTDWPININILQFPYDVLRKMPKKLLLTNLGDEMELFLKSRCYKRSRVNIDPPSITRKCKITRLFDVGFPTSEDIYTPPPSPPSYIDLLGFSEGGSLVTQRRTEEVQMEDILTSSTKGDKSLRLSRDSGVGNDLLTASPEKNKMFFPPIAEENEEIRRDLFINNEPNRIEIIENMLLSPKNQVPLNENDNNNDNSTIIEEHFKNENIVENEVQTTTVSNKDCSDENIPEALGIKSEEVVTENGSLTKQCENTSTQMVKENNQKDNKDSLDTSDVHFDLDSTNDFNVVFPTISGDSELETSNINERHLELTGDTAAKIQKWHKHLQPILANSRERHHFDVFQIGTNIIDEFSEQERKGNSFESITFQNVMEQQDPSYVSRYFLSTLLLANQGNVELNVRNKCDGRPSEWDDLHLKLVSTTRHVVAMEDNIGLVTTKTTTPQTTSSKKPKAPVQTLTTSELTNTTMECPPAKKRCVSTLNVNLNRIEMVKPIGKIPRHSDDYDSGIYSNDDFDNL